MMYRVSAALLIVASVAPIGAQDFWANPTYGRVTLGAGFEPDPHTVDVVAGGRQSARSLGADCRGMVANAPDYSIRYTAGGGLGLSIGAISSVDTTIVVNDPSGGWHCDDDSFEDGDPIVVFESPESGRYDVWVGVYDADDAGERARIIVTELYD